MQASPSRDPEMNVSPVETDFSGWYSGPGYEVHEILIQIKDICLSFDGKKVLDGVSADVRNIVRPGCLQGQIVGILGPSGIGKTQLSRILSGQQLPTSGSVTVKGQSVTAGLVGFVPQNYYLPPHRTVIDSLTLASIMSGHDRKEAKERSVSFLQRFDLMDKADQYPANLSGGQRQRVSIVRQLLCSEHFIVMDEPFTGLDPVMKDRTCDLINQVALLDESNTIFVVAHDIHAVASISDHLWLIGRDRDQNGDAIPGSKIRREYDLAAMGLAWKPDISSLPAFSDLVRDIRQVFKTL